MYLIVNIFIAILASIAFGYWNRDKEKNKRINLLTLSMALVFLLFFSSISLFLITALCSIAVFIYFEKHNPSKSIICAIVTALTLLVVLVLVFACLPTTVTTEETSNISLVSLHSSILLEETFS
jgi:apolipoprotein N-acyltransferase